MRDDTKAGMHKPTSQIGSSESAITVASVFLDCGRKPEYLEKSHVENTQTLQKRPELGFKLRAP